MLSIAKCIICGEEFVKKRKDKLTCSTRCNVRKFRKQTYINEKANCLLCGKEFIKTRKDKVCCSHSCSSRKYILKKNNEVQPNTNLIGDIKDFLNYMKRKSHYAELPDIFRLLDLHERLFPSTFINDDVPDKELIFSKMYLELIDFYKKSTVKKSEF